jgi:hypothetical protein
MTTTIDSISGYVWAAAAVMWLVLAGIAAWAGYLMHASTSFVVAMIVFEVIRLRKQRRLDSEDSAPLNEVEQ